MKIFAQKRKWYIYLIAAVVIVLGYTAVNAGLTYRTIVVDDTAPKDRTSLWGGISGLFGSGESMPIIFNDPNPMPDEEPSRLDVLIMGMRGDDGEIEAGQWLTDTMILASLDKTTGTAAMISIPRDLWIDMYVPEFQDAYRLRGKMNEVYVKGLTQNAGITLAKQVVSKMTGVYVDHAVVFDFEAFREIVDTLGGIDITLAQPFSEPEQWGYPFELEAGDNHLTGEDALYYVRSRYSTSDFDRARRQKQVMEAIRQKGLSLEFLSNPININNLLSDLKGNIRTDVQPWVINDMLELAQSLSDTQVKHVIMTPDNVLRESHGTHGEYILLPQEDNYDSIKHLAQNIL